MTDAGDSLLQCGKSAAQLSDWGNSTSAHVVVDYYSRAAPSSAPPCAELPPTTTAAWDGLGPGQACHLAASASILP